MALLKVATFNVNSVRSRMHVLTKWLHDNRVDVLCLQETKTEDQFFPASDFESIGYNASFRGEKAYNGVALLSTHPIENAHFGFEDGESPDPESRIVRGTICGVHIINTYVPQGKAIDHPDYLYKMRFFDRLKALFEREYSTDEKVVWLGDMNVAPTDIDVTSPERKRDHVCFHEDIKKKFEEVKDWGFVDIFRKYRPEEGEFSFFDYRVKNALERNIGWRIDHILATSSLADCSTDCYVDREPRGWEKPSDHTPVVSVFDI
ncbi:MAG: exodeoxyribonuclease III [Aminobacterium sp.]|nr:MULTISPECIES: exodeoxyribonuclease III [unclassified Aminobacterium]MDD2205998.1 exodeoxyribonuclease III [Aminobacterium sp.]MDD3425867.1 exodeoxyribonuclease III [Aminobacterium sp.]MDD3707175.1 exodeoxyribonuclease III [Aminobacterium sp.]MDD4227845.1 exodeoxyribonuclease III [Aminobacterium sp.]MDD4550715.1 exodeoxyribonuclease III [Aminobacterium sp.]